MKKKFLFYASCGLLLLFTTSCNRDDDYNTPNTSDPTPSVGGFDQNGASIAVFSVSENKTVHFSRGNLQFISTTGSHIVSGGESVQGYWKFAEHQYDYSRYNDRISENNGYAIDLFGWGTSGWNSGANKYQPWDTSILSNDYYPGGDYTNNLTGDYSNADWGVYNAIRGGGNQPGMWRTLTGDEWRYLLFTRSTTAVNGTENARYSKAQVNGVNGLIILPDNFRLPAGLTLENINISNAIFESNTYSVSAWDKLEAAGAIFLPASGIRQGTEIRFEGTMGSYWASTTYTNPAQSVEDAQCLNFYKEAIAPGAFPRRYHGESVRLVQD